MNRLIVLLFTVLCVNSYAQIFQGIEHLQQYEPEITELDQYLKSTPKKYLSLYPKLRQKQKANDDKVLESALDVYQGSYYYFINNWDSSTYYFDKAMQVSSEIGQDQIFRTAKIRRIFTDEYKKTKYQMAKEMEAIYIESYNQKDTINLLYSLNGLALFYGDMDSLSMSLNIFYEALRISDLSQNMNEKGFIHNNLGLLKYDLGAHDSAFSDFKQCLKIGLELDNKALEGIARQNMGLYYTRVDSNERAREEYMKVMDIGKESGYTLYLLSSTTNLATLEMTEGNPKASDSLSNIALNIAKEGHLLYSVPNIYLGRAFYKMSTDRYDEALVMLDSVLAYAKYAQYSEVMPPYYHLRYRIYEEQEDYENAFKAYKEKVAVNDSLDEIGNAQLLAELQFKYDDEKKERIRSVKENKLKLEIKQNQIDMANFQQRVFMLIGGFVLVILVIIILYIRLKQKSDNLFSFTIANKLEEERGRIARDLHDGLGQSMIVLKNRFNNLDVNNEDQISDLNNNFSEVIEEVRSISRSLIPPELRRLGLIKAIETMMNDIEQSTGMIVTTDLTALENVEFEEHQSIRLYRIIQELCTNTIKHAGASSIKLDFIKENGVVYMTYRDNGAGLDLEKWKSAENSVGFKSIQQRLKYLKGTIKVEKPKIGFKVELKFPIA